MPEPWANLLLVQAASAAAWQAVGQGFWVWAAGSVLLSPQLPRLEVSPGEEHLRSVS